MSLIKGTLADINPAFLQKLKHAFPEKQSRYREGDTFEELVRRSAHLEVVDWIEAHANLQHTQT